MKQILKKKCLKIVFRVGQSPGRAKYFSGLVFDISLTNTIALRYLAVPGLLANRVVNMQIGSRTRP